MGQGTKLPLTDDEEKFDAAADLFRRLLRQPRLSELTLGTFVQNLLKEDDLIKERRNDWEVLARAYGGNDRAKWEAIRNLADKLKESIN